MGSIRSFVIDVPPLDDAIINAVRRAGAEFDSCAEDVLEFAEKCDESLGPNGPHEHVEVTFRELGCTSHPTYREGMHADRLLAWSAANLLEQGMMAEHTEAAALLAYTFLYPNVRPGVLIAGMEPLATSGMDCGKAVLSSVQLNEEWWFYGMTVEGGHRFSLDTRVLLQIRKATPGELEAMRASRAPEQPKALKSVTCAVRPVPIPNEYPGKFCGHEAIRSLLLGFHQDAPLKNLRRQGGIIATFWGWFFNLKLNGRTLPGDIAAILRDKGFDATWRWWSRASFERKLKEAINQGYYVDVITYAQRRYHGQHSELVSGYELYDTRYYWYVTDAQFGLKEYDLPQGNTLLSTPDLERSFPRYGLWMFAFGAFVVLVKPRS